MTIPATDGGTRRTLFRVWLAGIVAVAAQAVGRPLHADAADGDTVKVGRSFTGTRTTRISTTGVPAIQGSATGGSIGVIGRGSGPDAQGVVGVGPFGVVGQSGAANGRGVRGIALHTTGTGQPIGVFGTAKSPTGFAVFGRNDATAGEALGVMGETLSPNGYGVRGFNRTGSAQGVGVGGAGATAVQGLGDEIGVSGFAFDEGGIGVRGSVASTGIGGSFEAPNEGVALKADGPVQFSSAGIATIPAGTKQATVTPGVPVDGQSKILCTLIDDPGLSRLLYAQPGTNAFAIHMTQNVAGNVKVAWFVID